jgi:hypothetical protein
LPPLGLLAIGGPLIEAEFGPMRLDEIEHLRPRALRRFVAHRDCKIGHGGRWYYRMGRRVWFHENRPYTPAPRSSRSRRRRRPRVARRRDVAFGFPIKAMDFARMACM